MRIVNWIESKQNAMAGLTGAIKREPFGVSRRTNKCSSAGRQPNRNLISSFYGRNDPPGASRNPFPPRQSSYAGHVCSKKGLVIPIPSLPEEG